MRLLTHNTLRNNAADAKGKGFPLKITATEIRVDNVEDDTMERDRALAFVKSSVLSMLDWDALVQAAHDMGISTLPPQLTDDLMQDEAFLLALYHILMHVHLIQGTLTCPVTGRQFAVTDGIPNMILPDEDCEHVRL